MLLVYVLLAFLCVISFVNTIQIRRNRRANAALLTDVAAVTKIGTATLTVLNKLPTPEEFQRVKDIAGQAYDITVGLIPDAGIKVQKVGDQIVATGMPNRKG